MIAVSIDGALVAAEDATVSVFDRGLLYGDGCFEVLRTWNGVAVDLALHLDRLYSTARFLALQTIERTALDHAVARTITAAGAGEHRIRIVLTRGPGGLSQRFAELGRGRAIVIVEPLPELSAALSCAIVDWPIARHGEGRKTLAYLDSVIAHELAHTMGADEAIRLDDRGNIIEGATSNLFAVCDGTVVTPPTDAGALPGIVRGRVLSSCKALSITSETRLLSVSELLAADEVFVTSSLRGVVAVICLDGESRPVGQITTKLARAYGEMMRAAGPDI